MKARFKTIEYGPINNQKTSHGYKNVRWVENVSRGLRLVGFADEIAHKEGSRRSIDHKGWFIDDDGASGETYRGVVYQLPSHGDEGECYVYGYADPINDDCALLSFDVIGDKMEAARQADHFAECFAEEERDYRRARQAGCRYDVLADEISTARKEALAIADEMRRAKRHDIEAPTICATLRATIKSLYHKIQKARKERAELLSDYGRSSGFAE